MKKKTTERKKTYKYIAMPGGCLSAEKAAVAAEEFQRIARVHGCIKPAILVAESKPENAPLHDCFTWNNREAAEQWRLAEARQIIRSVRIVEDTDVPHAEQPVIRAFVHVEAHDEEDRFEGGGYLPIVDVMEHAEYQEQALAAAMSELRQWQHRYTDLKGFFSGVFTAIDEAAQLVEKE